MKIPFFGGKSKDEKTAKSLIAAAYSVYNYRCDVMGDDNAKKLHDLTLKVEELFDGKKIYSEEYKKLSAELEKHMRKFGGKIYPLSFWSDNVDVVIVAGILALSVRSFFFQTFQIPTNSMYPSFYGMTPHVYHANEESPQGVAKLARYALKGASNYNVKIPESGEVFIEINPHDKISQNDGLFKSITRPARWLGILPSMEKVYFFHVNDKILELSIPPDFSLDTVMKSAYPFGTIDPDLGSYLAAVAARGKIVEKNGKLLLSLGNFKKGDKAVNFDILAGDMLIVDRLTYNFRAPKVGDPFVFRTGNIPRMAKYSGGISDDKYYIKRLAGLGGDTLKIEGSSLIRNEEPIKGAEAFEFNAKKIGQYSGYMPYGDMKDGKSVKVPPKHYYALGDNSANSLDSRYWGGVPEKSVAGKAVLIFYPFTERWGAAK